VEEMGSWVGSVEGVEGVCRACEEVCGGFVLGEWSVSEGSVEEMGSWVGSFECGCGRDDLVCWLKGM